MGSAGPHLQIVREIDAECLLIRLDSAQRCLIEAIAHLGGAIDSSCPSKREYACAQLRLSQAILTRRPIFDAVCDFLRGRVVSVQRDAIAELCAADADLVAESARHISEWTNDRIEADWSGYRLESKRMRLSLGNLIELERAVLYPLLIAAAPETRFVPARY